MVELSGNCPPSPKSRTDTFSRLSFDFSLRDRLLETGISFAADPFVSDDYRIGILVPAGVYDGLRVDSGDLSHPVANLD